MRISWAIWREEYIYRARIFAPYGCNRKILRCLAQSGLIASLQVRYLIHCCCALHKRSFNYLNNNKNLSTKLSGTLLRREGKKNRISFLRMVKNKVCKQTWLIAVVIFNFKLRCILKIQSLNVPIWFSSDCSNCGFTTRSSRSLTQ